MNAPRLSAPNAPAAAPLRTPLPAAAPARHVHRERDFGIGYGNSSGYASERRYVREWMQPRFRCA
ncbi:hypothetical protein [Vulcaniibacterium tengchongense]|uniref:Uncharacterized protein n=1 Tax=Vulcaniibacterium tengchongense TaxID=1273429 RepID=A0A3N4VSK2_9GAMM|nr:hypothetical protein [Vulcaniibacterium tengchongense]RPE80057.1 hypothetical protein EDC50_1888 [Vulcaniibacterium tengchongense]